MTLPGRCCIRRLSDSLAALGRLPAAEDRLPAADALVPAVPGPVPVLVGVHELQAADPVAVQLDGQVQVGPGHGDPDDLDQRAVTQRLLRPRLGLIAMQQVRGYPLSTLVARVRPMPVMTSSG